LVKEIEVGKEKKGELREEVKVSATAAPPKPKKKQ
jgi:hypothetical protein